MGQETGIAWTDHTFNPWWGCVKVSPGCAHCYAEAWDARWKGGHWGKDAPRRFFGASHWREPLTWNAAAQLTGKRARVFCGSMCDVFEDRPDLEGPRADLFSVIRQTPWLDWQLLTKRPGNVLPLLPAGVVLPWPNVWIGTTVEDEIRAAERIPSLLEVPAVVRFLSVEPLLERVNLRAVSLTGVARLDALRGHVAGPERHVDWVIVGGESNQPGAPARPCALEWIEDIVGQCRAARVPVFVKQLGDRVVSEERTAPLSVMGGLRQDYAGHFAPNGEVWAWKMGLGARAGSEPAEWPEELNVREFPEVARAG